MPVSTKRSIIFELTNPTDMYPSEHVVPIDAEGEALIGLRKATSGGGDISLQYFRLGF